MTATKEAPKELMAFRLNQGCHEQTAEGWERPVDKDGKPVWFNPEGQPLLPKSHMYRFNEEGNNIVRSSVDLAKKYGEEKFSYLSGDGSVVDLKGSANRELVRLVESQAARLKELEAQIEAQKPTPEKISLEPGVEGMTAKQLASYCQDNEIDAKGCKSREDYLAAIQLHKNAPTK